jgi:hypothetical protein
MQIEEIEETEKAPPGRCLWFDAFGFKLPRSGLVQLKLCNIKPYLILPPPGAPGLPVFVRPNPLRGWCLGDNEHERQRCDVGEDGGGGASRTGGRTQTRTCPDRSPKGDPP